MKNSLKGLFTRLQENNGGALSEGFKVLKNIRGGKSLPTTNSGAECTNSGTSCSGENKHRCTNSGDCTGATNPNVCSNGTCVY